MQYSQATGTNASWSSVALAFVNSGGLRGDLEVGNISKYDVLTVFPFGDTLDVITISGEDLVRTFEQSVSGEWRPNIDGGMKMTSSILQVSGFRMTVDPCRPVGSRIVKLLVRCADCRVPRYSSIKRNLVYRVATSSYLAGGGSGFNVLKEGITSKEEGPVDKDVFIDYIARMSPITMGVENRISVLDNERCWSSGASTIRSTNIYAPILVLVFIVHVLRDDYT